VKNAQVFAVAHRREAPMLALHVAGILRDAGVAVALEPTLAEHEGAVGFAVIPPDRLGEADMALAFGGDGTVLRVVSYAARHGTPVLGVNMGQFGFITYCRPAEVETAIANVLSGNYHVEERLMLRAEVMRAGACAATAYSLNEIVMQRGTHGKMMTIDISINDIPVVDYPSDGVMVATPTGSTAYNLSAGGPVASPTLDAMLLTPLTAHTLGARPLVLEAGNVVRIRIATRGEAVLVADGDSLFFLEDSDEIVIRKAEYPAKLLLTSRNDFYERLRKRLLFGVRRAERHD
jgi:NAD+ kinase